MKKIIKTLAASAAALPLIITPLAIVSCGSSQVNEADFMFGVLNNGKKTAPLVKQTDDATKTDFVHNIFKSFSATEKKQELFYQIYAPFFIMTGGIKDFFEIKTEDSFISLIDANKAQIVVKNSSNVIGEKDGKLNFSYLGYASFQFLTDYTVNENISYKKSDYVMITYDFKNIELNPNEFISKGDNQHLINFSWSPNYGNCLGFMKIKTTKNEGLISIPLIDTKVLNENSVGLPTNHHNLQLKVI